MVTQFAAHLSNVDTEEESMIVADTAEKAEELGDQQVKAEAARGVRLEMIAGALAGDSPYPTGQVMKVSKVA